MVYNNRKSFSAGLNYLLNQTSKLCDNGTAQIEHVLLVLFRLIEDPPPLTQNKTNVDCRLLKEEIDELVKLVKGSGIDSNKTYNKLKDKIKNLELSLDSPVLQNYISDYERNTDKYGVRANIQNFFCTVINSPPDKLDLSCIIYSNSSSIIRGSDIKDDSTVLIEQTQEEQDTVLLNNDGTVLIEAITEENINSTNNETVYIDDLYSEPTSVNDANTQIKDELILGLYKEMEAPIQGGMGAVQRVHHTQWNVDLAMKQPHAKYYANDAHRQMFIDECESWINLGLHPHIVSCYYVRDIDGKLSVFSEWMDGGSLKDIILNESLYDGDDRQVLMRIMDIAIQFARGLNYAHENGLVHQDVKPANLMLSKDGTAKVSDFGIAKVRSSILHSDTSFADGTIITDGMAYTPEYCSPEQLCGEKITRRTDIWSWAVSVVEMFTGECKWDTGLEAKEKYNEYVNSARISIPNSIQDLLHQCLANNSSQRPHDFKVIEERLVEIYHEEIDREYARESPDAASDTADSLNNKALSYVDIGKTDTAIKLWNRALEIVPEHTFSIYNKILLSLRQGLSDYIFLQMGLFVSRYDNWLNNYCYAKLLVEEGKYNSAIEFLKKAQEKNTQNAEITKLMEYCLNHVSSRTVVNSFSNEHHFENNLYRNLEKYKKPKVAFVNNGRECITVDFESSEIIQRNIDNGCKIFEYTGHNDNIAFIGYCDSISLLVSVSFDKILKLWNTVEHTCIKSIAIQEIPYKALFHIDGNNPLRNKLLIIDSNGLHLYYLCDFTVKTHVIRLGETDAYHWKFDEKGEDIVGRIHPDNVKWIPDKESIEKINRSDIEYPKKIIYSPDKRLKVMNSGEDSIEIWDNIKNKFLRKITNSKYNFLEVYFDEKSNFLITRQFNTGNRKVYFKIWQISLGKCVNQKIGEIKPEIKYSDNRVFAIYTKGFSHELWDLIMARRIFSVNSNAVPCFTNDGVHCIVSKIDVTNWSVEKIKLTEFDYFSDWMLSRIEKTNERLEIERDSIILSNKIINKINQKDISAAISHLDEAKSNSFFYLSEQHIKINSMLGKYCRTIDFIAHKHRNIFNKVISRATGSPTESKNIEELIFSPNNKYAYCLLTRNILPRLKMPSFAEVYDLENNEISQLFSDDISHMCLSSCGHYLFYCYKADKKSFFKHIDLAKKNEEVVNVPQNWQVTRLQYSPCGKYIGVGRFWQSPALISTNGYNTINEFEMPNDTSTFDKGNYSILFAPDGKKLIGSSQKELIIWDTISGKILKKIHSGRVERIFSISPDGKHVAAFSEDDGKFKYININTGECSEFCFEHLSNLTAVEFSKDGKFIFVYSRTKPNNCIKIFSVETGKLLDTIIGFTDHPSPLKISNDNNLLFVKNYKKSTGTTQYSGDILNILWQYEFPGWADWDEGARPYLEIFLALYPNYTNEDFDNLIADLQNKGYGWIRPEGIKRELEKMLKI